MNPFAKNDYEFALWLRQQQADAILDLADHLMSKYVIKISARTAESGQREVRVDTGPSTYVGSSLRDALANAITAELTQEVSCLRKHG